MNNADMPAMPVNAQDYKDNGGHECDSFGLTKREHFAAMAMQGFISAGVNGMTNSKEIALLAVNYADALLKDLEK